MSGRAIAIGDVHGCDVALATLLDRIAPTGDDTIVMLGDVVDRGPASRQCLDRILQLRDECRVVYVRGNHEEWMLNWLDGRETSWRLVGGHETIASYGSERIPESHIELLRSTVDSWETETEVFVHANWEPGCDDPPDSDLLRWCALTGNEQPHPDGKRIVCGHTAQLDGRPASLPGWVCIDTFASGGRWLTGLDVTADVVFRADQSGRIEGPRPLGEIVKPFDPAW